MILGFAFLIASSFAAILIAVGDICFYSNRDVAYWAYILNSAIPGVGFLIASALVHTLEVSLEKLIKTK